jgi:octaprenyl-diphosphate synthase
VSEPLASGVVPTEPPSLLIAADLERVEAKLEAAVRSREPRLTDVALHLIGAGGKRVRPMVALLVFRAAEPAGRSGRLDDMIDVAAALELIHSATLLHDDIIDASDRRRGRESALRRFGLADTLVAGDFVFSRAFEICARFEETVVQWAADACIALTEGEVMQGRLRRDPGVAVTDYLEIIARKTASLFRQGSRVAAYLAGADEPLQQAAAEGGHHIGMAFQMIDDLLDVVGNASITGKPTGADLREGNPSLPIVLALPRDAELRRLFVKSDLDEREVERALARIRASGVLATVRSQAEGHVARALERLRSLPETGARVALEAIAQDLTGRAA